MKTTPNYKLNQWERHDRVLMDDFNADNAKLDAAIKNVSSGVTATEGKISWLKLLDMTVKTTTDRVDVDVSKLNLTNYHMATLILTWSPNSKNDLVRLLCNGEADVYHTGTSSSYQALVSFSPAPGHTLMQTAEMYFSDCVTGSYKGLYWGTSSGKDSIGMSESTVALAWAHSTAELRTLTLKAETADVIGAGTKIQMYGLRK